MQLLGKLAGLVVVVLLISLVGVRADNDPSEWSLITRESKPGVYWWWPASAVDTTNITRELSRYATAGIGSVHIIPIYGVIGYEDRFIPFLSSKWVQMLQYVVSESTRLDLNVDMTAGSGWCFGGPTVTSNEANAVVVVRKSDLPRDGIFEANLNRQSTQLVMAYSSDGQITNLTGSIDSKNLIRWQSEGGPWTVYALSQKPSGQMVKRAGPGGARTHAQSALPKCDGALSTMVR